MKRKQLEWLLGDLETFTKPKVLLEQYATSPELAASIIQTIDAEENLADCSIADLGCGCGPLLIAAVAVGATYCTGFEIDADAIDICSRNLRTTEMNHTVDLVQCDVLRQSINTRSQFDCVIMNPPYGTKHNWGIDMKFVRTALSIASSSVYSLHKTTTRDYVLEKAAQFGAEARVLAELRYNLPATYKHHKRDSVDVKVDMIKFTKLN